MRDLIADIGLTTYPLTSGSKGLHLYVPLEEPISSRGASVLARRVAQQLERDDAQIGHRDDDQKSARRARCSWTGARTTEAKTTIAPYSLRGREFPTVAAPRTWDEIDDPQIAASAV